MKKLFSREWWFATIIFIVSISYFLFRVIDPVFRDNALGNLFATVMGVVVGIPIGLEINRVQQEAQRKREEEQKYDDNEAIEIQKKEEQEEILKANIQSVYRELTDNQKHVKRLQNALAQAKNSTQEHWEWISAISDSFTSDAYYTLDRSEIDENAWRELHVPLYIAYPMMLLALRNRIREGKAAHSFYLKYKNDQKSADDELKFIRDLSRETLGRIEQATQEVDRFKRYKKYVE